MLCDAQRNCKVAWVALACDALHEEEGEVESEGRIGAVDARGESRRMHRIRGNEEEQLEHCLPQALVERSDVQLAKDGLADREADKPEVGRWSSRHEFKQGPKCPKTGADRHVVAKTGSKEGAEDARFFVRREERLTADVVASKLLDDEG